MKKVYVVTDGCYSDYHIVAVFSTKEKSEEYIAYHGTNYRMEEYSLDKEFEREESVWCVSIDMQDGTASACRLNYYFEEVNTCTIEECGQHSIYFYVIADTSKKAIKVAHEHLGAIKANVYVWQTLNTEISETCHSGSHCWTVTRMPTYNFKEERFVDLD